MTFDFSDVWSALAPWLPFAEAVVKATVLLALAAAGALLLRRASAAARHFVWTAGLLGALVVPLLSFALPRWEVPLLTLANQEARLADPAADASTVAPRSGPGRRERRPAARSDADAGIPAGRPLPQVGPSAGETSVTASMSWTGVLLALWCVGAMAVIARLIVGLAAVVWLSRRTERVTDAPWLPLARALAAQMGVRPDLTFLRSPRTTMPMAWGILKPAVLMPADADGWPLERLRIVLLHELAHVRRRDCLTHALAQLACAVHWFNPLAWVAARRVRAERERACDDLVLAAGTRGSDYANQLLEIARVMRSGRFPALLTGATLAMAHRTQLEGRLIAILDPRVPRSKVSRIRSAAATALVAGVLIPLASVQPWAYASPPSTAQVLPPRPAATPSPAPAPVAQPEPVPQAAPRPAPDPAPLGRFVAGIAEAALEAVIGSSTAVPINSIVQDAVEGAVDGAIEGALEAAQEARKSTADPRTVAALTAALQDTDVKVREAAMEALVRLRDPSIFEPLVQALRDASPDIREHAAVGLGQLRDARAIEPLMAALKDTNASVREQAAFALGQLRDPAAIEALATALKDSSPSVREQAAFALGQIRDRRALAALTAAVSDSNESVREQAVFALGQLRDPAAVDALVAALRDSKADIRQTAVFALGQIRDRRAVPALTAALKDADPEVRGNAAFALGQLRDTSAVEALVVAIKDENAEVRGQVAFALGQIRDPRAIDALTIALKDANSEVRQQAAFALGQLAR